MLFHFLNLSQCVVCRFGHKTIYKVTNLKVHSKARYFVKNKNPFSRTTMNYKLLVWTTKLFSCICDITNCKSRLWKFEWLGVGRTLSLSSTRFKIEKSKLFSENVGCHFHFILHVMSEKATVVSGALNCVQLYQGNLELSRANSASRWQIINLHIYAATNSVSLWDYGINKC